MSDTAHGRRIHFVIALSVGVVVAMAYAGVEVVLACRKPSSEACVWGKAYLPLALALYSLIIGGPVTALVYAVLRGWNAVRRPRVSAAKKQRVDELLHALRGWAEGEPDIRAVALIGSYARDAATEASDVDLIIIAAHPASYLADAAWAGRFGCIARTRIERCGKVTALKVRYDDALEVEYGFTDEGWAAKPIDEGTRRVIDDGLRVLFERLPLLSRLR